MDWFRFSIVSQDTVLVLLQMVALTLPAVGIYLQIIGSDDYADSNLTFNLAKSSLLIISLSGISSVLYLLIIQIPPLGTGFGTVILTALIVASLTLIGFGISTFAVSVYFSFRFPMMIGQNPSIGETYYTLGLLLYRRIHPNKTMGPSDPPQQQQRQ